MMSAFRQAAGTATDFACNAFGRGQVVRAARFVLRRAYLDVPNDMRTNGEALLQRWLVDLSSPGQGICVVDVGANVGRWSASMLEAASKAGRLDDLDLHAFEPSSYTFARLSRAIGDRPVTLSQAALCERSGSAILHVIAPGAGINSLHEQSETREESAAEMVATSTLDEYARSARLSSIELLKIDTEGSDLAVLHGARGLLGQRRIAIAQFEYNYRWVHSRSYLRDAFSLLVPLGYRIGKLTPRGIEFYPRWDPDLETFVEGNYVACEQRIAMRLPSVRWWKQVS
jgi:FkbM family methyltransferase